jgi:catalase
MATINPINRVNYEPNSWGGESGGPREDPKNGFRSYPAQEEGEKIRQRPETFADHYSQARQFYMSQTPVERGHIARAFTFELSKVQKVAIRERVVAHLRNVHEDLATEVRRNLRLKTMPKPALAALPTRTDLKPSPALSILQNPPPSFAGRKVGVLISDGVDSKLLGALRRAVTGAGATVEIVAPNVGGVEASDGTWIEADQKLDGAPSVLYDAVALLLGESAGATLANVAPARDFIADAFAHLKVIAYTAGGLQLIEGALGRAKIDEGFVKLQSPKSIKTFLDACARLRVWSREPKVMLR